MAKNVLKDYDLGDDYEVMEIDSDPNCDAIQDYLRTITGARSVRKDIFFNIRIHFLNKRF